MGFKRIVKCIWIWKEICHGVYFFIFLLLYVTTDSFHMCRLVQFSMEVFIFWHSIHVSLFLIFFLSKGEQGHRCFYDKIKHEISFLNLILFGERHKSLDEICKLAWFKVFFMLYHFARCLSFCMYCYVYSTERLLISIILDYFLLKSISSSTFLSLAVLHYYTNSITFL